MRRGSWKSSYFPRIAGVQWSNTVGHGVGHGSRPGHRPRPCGDRVGILTAPEGGVVIAIACTVFQVWRGGVPWALQARVLHIYVRKR